MKLSGLGEKEVVKKLSCLLDVGDDAAYMLFGDRYLVASTDAICHRTHIPQGMTYEQVGRFIVSINLSDIASMGAQPLGFLLAYVGPDMEYGDFESLVRSAKERCELFGARYVGGDTKCADELVLCGTAFGVCEKPILRSGARIGDIVCVTGPLGCGAAFEHMAGENLKAKAFEPVPRVKEGLLLARYASAMTDISDSLSVSLYDIADQSSVALSIDEEEIPVLENSSLEHALFSGGDYELLFTVPEEALPDLAYELDLHRIGRVTSGCGVGLDGRVLEKRGYEHFSYRSKG